MHRLTWVHMLMGPPGNCPACPCVNAGLCLPWQKEKSLLKILLLVFFFFSVLMSYWLPRRLDTNNIEYTLLIFGKKKKLIETTSQLIRTYVLFRFFWKIIAIKVITVCLHLKDNLSRKHIKSCSMLTELKEK